MIGGKLVVGPLVTGEGVTAYGRDLHLMSGERGFWLASGPEGWTGSDPELVEFVRRNPPPPLDPFAPAGHPDPSVARLRALHRAVGGRLTLVERPTEPEREGEIP